MAALSLLPLQRYPTTSTATAEPRLQPQWWHPVQPSCLRLSVLLIRFRFAFLPLFSTICGWSDTKIHPHNSDKCVTRLNHRRFMKEVPWYQVVSHPPSTQIPVGVVNCCIVIISTSQWSKHSVHFHSLYIVERRDIGVLQGCCRRCAVVGLLTSDIVN